MRMFQLTVLLTSHVLQFLPRYAMQARPMLSSGVCVYCVRVSVRHVREFY